LSHVYVRPFGLVVLLPLLGHCQVFAALKLLCGVVLIIKDAHHFLNEHSLSVYSSLLELSISYAYFLYPRPVASDCS